MNKTSITSANLLIAVTLLGAMVTEDKDRTYLSGEYIEKTFNSVIDKLPGAKFVRDNDLCFHLDWNHLIDAVKEFKNNAKIFAKYDNAIDDYQRYFNLVNKIQIGLSNTNIEVVFESLTEGCDWLINLKETKEG
jgi:hypothetical protein